MKLTLVTDAWTPQVNGVVRTLVTTVEALKAAGHHVQTITPSQFRSVPCPTYPEIRLALTRWRKVARMIRKFEPDAIHIATEGPLGIAARRYCVRHKLPFTTAFHTRFPDYVSARTGLSPELFWSYLRWFHKPSRNILTATPRLAAELAMRGLPHTVLWSRGVDLSLFSPRHAPHPAYANLTRPIMLCVGRVAVEKNIETFLKAPVPGTKVVVGDGPALERLKRDYPQVTFLGALHGDELAAAYAGADVLAFPSLTDTFGLVMVEALASGVPVAGFPVPGPLDVIGEDGRGVVPGWIAPIGGVDPDFAQAISKALTCARADCQAYARHFSWDAAIAQFISALQPLPDPPLPHEEA